MADNLIAPRDHYAELDWMEYAGCVADDPEDTRFIRRPTTDEEEEWGGICARCPVFSECLDWGDRMDVSSVYVAGEWRE